MKKTLLILTMFCLGLIELNAQAQCFFGNYPPTYTVNPGWTNGVWFARKYTLATSATLSGLGLNSLSSSTLIFRMALYTDNSNTPGNLVQSTAQGTMVQGLNGMPVQTPTVIPAGSYWIVAIYGNSSVGVSSLPGASTPYLYQSGNLSTLPSNNSTWTNGSNYDLDFYALINAPLLAVSGPTQTCLGSAVSLTASGAITYSWSTGATSGTIAVTPSVNTTYTVGGLSALGCPNYTTFQVVANPLPTLAAASSGSVCPNLCNGSVSLTVTGGTGPYTFSFSTASTASSSSAPVVFNALCSGAYSGTVTDSKGCAAVVTSTIGADPSPTITVTGKSVLCLGDTTNLTASGAGTYTWNTGANSANVFLTPNTSSVYVVTGTGTNGCVSSANYSVTVNPRPTVSLSLSQTTICLGESSNLSITGVSGATLMNTSAAGTLFVLSPSVTTVYSVIGDNSFGCTSNATIPLVVDPCTGLNHAGRSQSNIVVKPNPSTGKFRLVTEEQLTNVVVSVFDLTGQLVEERQISDNDATLDLTTEPNGVYIVCIRLSSGIKTIKVVKQ